MKNFFYFILFLSFLWSCQTSESADTVLINGNIITVDNNNPKVEAIAIIKDRIYKLGSTEAIKKLISQNTKVIDLHGNFAMPGFIEGHGHFSGLGNSLMNLNFLTAKSWDEIIAQVAQKAKTAQPGEWITGRGWHQEKWTSPLDQQIHGYPFHNKLSELTPNNPVVLQHASGHSLFANKKAMELAGINIETPNPSGGEIIRSSNGEAIGVFEENAMMPIRKAYLEYLETIPSEEKKAYWLKGIELAQKECLANGITSFHDAGASFQEIDRYKNLAENNQLDIRLWTMIGLPYDSLKGKLDGFPIINKGNHFFTCRAIKSYVDGALGSFGAWLLKPYNDKPSFVGQNTTTIEEITNIAALAFEQNLQLCVHAIGDRANREVLDIFEKTFHQDSSRNDLRWRIEHAQHLHPNDIPRFKKLQVIAAMQGIHCTSDAPFVIKRLGLERAQNGAYAWRSLLDEGVVIANGTDAPVEDVNPIPNFYASVSRKRTDTGLEFFPEQRMTREEAIYSYTLGNAFAAFEENDKGSITEGKLADIVVLSKDLLHCTNEDILATKVLYTIVGGIIKYETHD